MSIIIFTGPTLSPKQCQELVNSKFPSLDALISPPAKQGDIYRATLKQPKAIAIIDGYFQSVPAIWHKEILYAMSQGICVFGSSSMGAIRAAELALFGMQGIGSVYQQFADNSLEDDDEVAVLHAPKELGYQPITDAMVNIRATFKAAHQQGLINQQQLTKLLNEAKGLHYSKRCYQQILAQAKTWLDNSEHQTLHAFIQTRAINIKQNDAIALIEHIAAKAEHLPKQTVNYGFAHTDAWQALVNSVNQQAFDEQNDIDIAQLIDELKLQGQLHNIKTQAQARQITLHQAQKHQNSPTEQQIQTALMALAEQQQCIENNQVNFDKLAQWFSAERLSPNTFHQLIQKQALLNWVDSAYDDIKEPLIDVLRLNNQLGKYLTKIAAKQTIKAQHKAPITLEQLGITEQTLWQWYFNQLQQAPAKNLTDFAKSIGFDNIETLRQSLILEYFYHLTQA